MILLKKISLKHVIVLILLLTAFLRLYRLNYPNKYVFDEVYHAFTAKEFLAGHKEAWEWWTAPPPGVAYEWTHPPLAKEIMAGSMFLVHSQDAWAWRLPGALLGVLSVYLVYLLGLKLLNNQIASIVAAFVFSIDGLNFVQSRTGMNDIYYITFMLICLLILLNESPRFLNRGIALRIIIRINQIPIISGLRNKRFILSALFLGLALASKWAAVYTYLIIIPLLLKDRRFFSILYFMIIPPLVYLGSYIPFFLLGHNFDQFIQLQQQMWWYHTNLRATHTYASPWWSWPFNLYPIWYFVDYQKNNIANIFASGNPAVFWTGSAAILLTAIEVVRKKSVNLFIILLGFFAFWLPWAISPRIMFLYHFSPSVPFLSLALGHQLNTLLKDAQGKKLAFILLSLMIISFILLFPYLTGLPFPKEFINLFFLTNLSKNPFQ